MAIEFESLQEAAQELAEDVGPHDAAGLKALSDTHLREQHDAREELFAFVDDLWENAKTQGLDPAVRAEYASLAGLRDLVTALRDNAADLLTEREASSA
ncbi:hypothetical protein [Embleya sp. NPDC005575]|uniref:hypothetical protein n=1 Tax=Embleya sp. NPDC005575 TaxID=3156892 RepID=UPI0033AAA377